MCWVKDDVVCGWYSSTKLEKLMNLSQINTTSDYQCHQENPCDWNQPIREVRLEAECDQYDETENEEKFGETKEVQCTTLQETPSGSDAMLLVHRLFLSNVGQTDRQTLFLWTDLPGSTCTSSFFNLCKFKTHWGDCTFQNGFPFIWRSGENECTMTKMIDFNITRYLLKKNNSWTQEYLHLLLVLHC